MSKSMYSLVCLGRVFGWGLGCWGGEALVLQVRWKGESPFDNMSHSCHLNHSLAQQRQLNLEKIYFLPASGSWSIL